jgi:hypothetical protein
MKVFIDYENKKIRLTDERRDHILLHPEMKEMESKIEKTLKTPEQVIRSKTDEAANLFYRYYYATLVGDKWLCIVVKYEVDEPFILTAYLTDKPKEGKQLWPKK